MKISLAQYEVKRGDPATNLKRIEQFVSRAADAGSMLVCLPEMATTGFDWKANRNLLESSNEHLEAIAEMAKVNKLAICGSFLEKTEAGEPANTLHFIDSDGVLLAQYRKLHLFSLFQEDQHMESGSQIVVAETNLGKTGFGICYDLRFPELFRKCAELGARVQILPAAFPRPRLHHWRTLVQARAIENQCFFLAINQCGFEIHGHEIGTTQYFGHSMIVDPWGRIVAEADEEECLLSAEIDLNLVEETRGKLPALKDRMPDFL